MVQYLCITWRYNGMHMPSTIKPNLPRLRMQVARLVINDGFSTRKAARYSGYNQSTVVRWVKEARHTNRYVIPTKSSRPHSHPDALSRNVVQRIIGLRGERDQCAEILHHRLIGEGVTVSLSSVKRTLKRYGLSRFSPWKKWHQYPPRPLPEKPGILVEIDTMWDGLGISRLYVYTLLDVCSRWAFAWPSLKADSFRSIAFLEKAREASPFVFKTLQSDHGSEFSTRFTKRVEYRGMAHRHARIRTPNDNAHLERFNLTLQRECLSRVTRSLRSYQKAIPEYLRYYNSERPHMGLHMRTPIEVMRSY